MIKQRHSRWPAVLLLLLWAEAGLSLQSTIRFNQNAPLSPIPSSDGEFDAFKRVEDERNPDTRLRLANDFLSDYDESEFRHLILRLRWQAIYQKREPRQTIEAALEAAAAEEFFLNAKMGFISDPGSVREVPIARLDLAGMKTAYYQSVVDAYEQLGDSDNSMKYAEMALEANAAALAIRAEMDEETASRFKSVDERSVGVQVGLLQAIVRAYQRTGNAAKVAETSERLAGVLPNDAGVLRSTMAAYQRAGDVRKTLEMGRRLLKVDPADLQALVNVPKLMVQNPPQEPKALQTYMREAEVFAESAVERAEAFFKGSDSAQLSDAQKARIMADIHVTLGAVKFYLDNFAEASQQYSRALAFAPDDAVAYYMLGLASNNQQQIDEALSALARAVYLQMPGPQARQNLERIYRIKYGALEGLEAFIQEEGRKTRTPSR